jgi:hypothetical protein
VNQASIHESGLFNQAAAVPGALGTHNDCSLWARPRPRRCHSSSRGRSGARVPRSRGRGARPGRGRAARGCTPARWPGAAAAAVRRAPDARGSVARVRAGGCACTRAASVRALRPSQSRAARTAAARRTGSLLRGAAAAAPSTAGAPRRRGPRGVFHGRRCPARAPPRRARCGAARPPLRGRCPPVPASCCEAVSGVVPLPCGFGTKLR